MGGAALPDPLMKIAFARSRCECQARLVARLNEQRHVLQAHTVDLHGHKEPAPAHSIGASSDRFDIGWLCSVCGRNVLRSFSAEALLWTEETPDPTAQP